MENISKQQFIIGVAAIAIIVFGIAAWYFLDFKGTTGGASPNNGTTVDLSQGATTTDAYSVELISSGEAVSAPSLDRAIPATSPNLDASVRAQLIANIQATIARLKVSPDSYNDWMLLGGQRQMAGDYEGAKEAWVYMTQRAPNEATPYGNLGNLYAVYLKDYARAETNYKAAISRSSNVMSYYVNLHEVYRYHLKDTTKAVEILKQGIQNIPKEISLHVTLARYYKDLGRTSEAKTEYDAAITAAQAGGQASVATQLQEERDSL